MGFGQAIYAVAVLFIVGWYTVAVWRFTDDYFKEEFKKHLRESKHPSRKSPPVGKVAKRQVGQAVTGRKLAGVKKTVNRKEQAAVREKPIVKESIPESELEVETCSAGNTETPSGLNSIFGDDDECCEVKP